MIKEKTNVTKIEKSPKNQSIKAAFASLKDKIREIEGIDSVIEKEPQTEDGISNPFVKYNFTDYADTNSSRNNHIYTTTQESSKSNTNGDNSIGVSDLSGKQHQILCEDTLNFS